MRYIETKIEHCMAVDNQNKCGICFEPYTPTEDREACELKPEIRNDMDYSQFNRYVRCEMFKLNIPECTKCPDGEYLTNKTGEYKCDSLL